MASDSMGSISLSLSLNAAEYQKLAEQVIATNEKLAKSAKYVSDENGKVSEDTTSSTKKTSSNAKSIGVAAGVAASLTNKAMSAIGDHIGSAVKRVDTLRQFPKVMQNLGFSSEDASAAIQDISDRLVGLPTSTDTIADATKRLASQFDSLDEAKDVALALNDAMLAGGSGTQVASAATEQFIQMLSSGKVDMQAWRSVLTAASPQMQQLATDMLGAGASTDDLYEALKNGEVSTNDLAKAMVKLDKEGGENITSFSQQAKDATDGIDSAWANLGNAIDRGLTDVINSIGVENITSVIGGIGTAFEQTFQIIGDVIKPVADLLGAIMQNQTAAGVLQGIATAIGVLAAAIGAYKLVALAVTAVQGALNAVFALNPFTLVALAIAAIIAVILVLIKNFDAVKQAISDFFAPVGEWIQAFKDNWGEAWEKIQGVVQEFVDFWAGFGEFIMNGLAAIRDFFSEKLQAIGQFFNDLGENIHNVWTNVINFIRGIPDKIVNFFVGIKDRVVKFFEDIKTGIKEKFNAVVDWVKGVPDKVVNALGDVKDLLYNAGKNIIEGFFRGLKAIWDKVTGWVSNIAGWIADHKGPLPYDARLLIPAGKAIMQGLNDGLQSGFGAIEDTIADTNSLLGVTGSGSYTTTVTSNGIADTALSDGKIKLDASTLGAVFENALNNKKWVLTTSGRNLAVMMIDDIDKELQLKASRERF